MHNDHEVFIQGIEQKRKLKLAYFCRQGFRKMAQQCAPLHYSKGKTEEGILDCYYIWFFEAERGNNFLALFPSQIVAMELTEETFNLEDIDSRQREKVE